MKQARKGERERISMESTWAPADLRILHYFTVYTHKWGYNETMIRGALSRSRSLLIRILQIWYVLAVVSLSPCRHYYFSLSSFPYCCSLWALFCYICLYFFKYMYVSIYEKREGRWVSGDDKWILWNATKNERKRVEVTYRDFYFMIK